MSLPPDTFTKAISSRWGKPGEEWLARFPDLLKWCEERFSITIGNSLESSTANFLATAKTENGTSVILKIGFPDSEFNREADALRAFQGKKIVRLLDSSPELSAMVLQKVSPGKDLTTLGSDEEATQILASFIRDLPVAVPRQHSFPTICNWLEVIDRIESMHPLPTEMLSQALKLHEELDATKKENKLLHGDLHHYNILWDNDSGWTAIDPQSVTGDPIFEAARMLHNPDNFLEVNDAAEKMKRRIKILSDILECDPKRVIGWGFVDCIIAACWSVEDHHDGWKNTVECARILHSFL